MTRDVSLLAYLPPFMQDFTEIAATLNAEDPEFVIVWDSADRVLKTSSSQLLMNTAFQGLKNPENSSFQRRYA